MSWVTVGVMAASSLMGAKNAEAKREQQERFNKAQAETSRYSPWTGMKGQLDSSFSPSALSGGLGGAVQGLGMAQSMKAAGIGGGAATAAPTSDGSSYLGGQDMSNQLAAQGNSFQSSMSKPNLFSDSNNMQPPNMGASQQAPGQGWLLAGKSLFGGGR